MDAKESYQWQFIFSFFFLFLCFPCIQLTMNRFKEKSTVRGLIIENFILLVRY